jgi:methylisocitrate lyase
MVNLLFAVISFILIILIARTDAYGVDGIDACITRSKAYIDAGADMIFPEGLE